MRSRRSWWQLVLTAGTYTSVLMAVHFRNAAATAQLVLATASKNPGKRYKRATPTRPRPQRPRPV